MKQLLVRVAPMTATLSLFMPVGIVDAGDVTTQGRADPTITATCEVAATPVYDDEYGMNVYIVTVAGRWDGVRYGSIMGSPVDVWNVTTASRSWNTWLPLNPDSRTSGTFSNEAKLLSLYNDPTNHDFEAHVRLTGRRMKVLAEVTVRCTEV